MFLTDNREYLTMIPWTLFAIFVIFCLKLNPPKFPAADVLKNYTTHLAHVCYIYILTTEQKLQGEIDD